MVLVSHFFIKCFGHPFWFSGANFFDNTIDLIAD